MFKPLGLFANSPCPDENCGRSRCFFSHAAASTSSLKPKPSSGPAIKRSLETVPAPAVQPTKRPKVEDRSREIPKAAPTKSSVPLSKVQVPPPTRGNLEKPPTIPIIDKKSPQPIADRQKALATLFTQYHKLYSQVIHLDPTLSQTSTLQQESEISSTASNIRAYKTAIHHAAVSVSRRPPPTSIPHPSIGTLKESRLATELAAKEAAGRLTRDRISGYILSLLDFPLWGYPDPNDTSLTKDDVASDPDGEGTSQVCARCKIPFIVSSRDIADRVAHGECRFHHGKPQPERVEGKRKWIYSCCGKERGESGCEDGVHVFSEGGDDRLLAKRYGYKDTREIGNDGGVDVVGMDCEMIYTTAGITMGRVTIVDDNGATLLDELVRQSVPVLDVNTRFSGITLPQLDDAVMDLDAVRSAACAFIGPHTIMVGHGLENDLRALRLLHTNVIDTAVLIPHDKGPPFRRALRDIVKEKLGYFIQDRTGDLGHSSAIDAIATLDVLKWKVREDAE
ncbi:RNA exonuclease, partial [Tremellales sp. Uapishka_1]